MVVFLMPYKYNIYMDRGIVPVCGAQRNVWSPRLYVHIYIGVVLMIPMYILDSYIVVHI